MDFLRLSGKNIVLMGVANRRSIAWAVAEVLREAGANLVYVFKDRDLLEKNRALIGAEAPALVCDVESESEMAELGASVAAQFPVVHGLVHSLAFANFSEGIKPFHATLKRDFLQAVDISCFSLVQVCNQLKQLFSPDASIVTMSISTTRMASENYGYMGPIKAALDSSVVFLAKSLSQEVSPGIRVNAVGAGLLKTSSSAGIPGYIDAYLYAEKVIPRKSALATREPADVIAFLLSERSSGINAQTLIVDAGMSINYFDRELVRKISRE
ncbi:MAG: SDR family oxidoreductase [Lentisphaerae bacterium]|jgi:enoyl-[acyl-carrier protein] reductase I|nr:SDR family oxidoreductase [Lentisphaerota bacterium]